MDTQLHRSPFGAGRAERILVGYKTDKGLRRSNNEDSHAVFTNGELGASLESLLVVADGMGGTKGGDIASNIVVNSLPEALQTLANGGRQPAHAPDDLAGTPTHTALLLTEAIRQANGEVWRYKTQHSGLENMGTTCVAAIVGEGIVTIGNVGDSRAYLLRAGRLSQITDDHSLVNEQVKSGLMTPEQAAASRFRNRITRAMGLLDDVVPDVTAHPLQAGDALLLCSDGLTTEVDDLTIARLLAQSPDPQSACDQLVAQALHNGGSDNVTVVVLHYGAFVPRSGQSVSALPRAAHALNRDRARSAPDDSRDDEDVTDPNQAWKRSLSSAHSAGEYEESRTRADRNDAGGAYREDTAGGEARYARSSRQFHENAPAVSRTGISAGLFGLVLLAAIGEAIALSLFWAGRWKPRPAPVIAPPVILKPTDKPLMYPGITTIPTRKALWNGLLQVTPDDRLLVMTQSGRKLLVTPGGGITEMPDAPVKLPPAPPPSKPDGLVIYISVPPAVTYDASGYRYELNPATLAIDKFDPSGTPLIANIGKGQLTAPAGLAVDTSGSLYVIDNHHLKRIAAVPDVGQPTPPPPAAPSTAAPAPGVDSSGSAADRKAEGSGQ